MTDFESARTKLKDARQAAAAARDALTATGWRPSTTRRPSSSEGSSSSDVSSRRPSATVAAANAKELGDRAAQAADEFAKAADPRTAIAAWAPATPLLLLPVRLETRFRQVDGKDELWVRIFPDDCAIDSFEADLSDTELTSGRRYWVETWAAGGIEAQRRAAWRNLVASHGSGRAAWIRQQYVPAAAEPVKDKAEDIILVIAAAADAAPSDGEKGALSAFWTAVWLADGDKQKKDDALATLSATPGVGDATSLIAKYKPDNLAATPAPPTQKGEVALSVEWLILPAGTINKTRSWSRAPRAELMPDCFVIQGWQKGRVVFEKRGEPIPSPLIVGPDPSAPDDQKMRFDADGTLITSEDMRWMVDFGRAVDVGMAIRVPLNSVDLSAPIERVLALGLRLADDAEDGRMNLERLLTDHRYSRSGLALVPQGTPTNNTETDGAGYTRGDDADESYDLLFGADAALTPETNWWKRRDGEWLADALGIDWHVLDRIANVNRGDLAEARAMSRALWPATVGYAMETMLHPLFGPDSVAAIRWFFGRFVLGRGFLPTLRIGNQPYGVLPTTVLSGWKLQGDIVDSRKAAGTPPAGIVGYLNALAALLDKARRDWSAFAEGVVQAGASGDPHQILLDVLALNPASVEFHQRLFQSKAHLYNLARFGGSADAVLQQSQLLLEQQGMQLLRSLGYTGDTPPDALSWVARSTSNRLNGPLIDDLPLSETAKVRPSASKNRNYIAWLADAARASFDDLRLENGFDDGAPDTLLYLMLRHGLLLGFWDTALRLHEAANLLTPAQASDARKEAQAIHLADGAAASESRYALLYSRNAQVSGGPGRTVAQRISANIEQDASAAALAEQLAALDVLKDVPTARLERCLTEHVDTACYRLDAWLLGIANVQLALSRYGNAAAGVTTHASAVSAAGAFGDERKASAQGLYLGAYGWLENLKKAPQRTAPVTLSGAVADAFKGGEPPVTDPANGGYIFAPSLAHATTAAILRAGYLSNASVQAPNVFSVNLSSARVRQALELIDGIRNGQPLGALLGYRLQRKLNADYPALGLDRFVQWLRQQFPLVANRMSSTQEDVSVETIEASNVLDGLKLADHVRAGAAKTYPFGLGSPPGRSPSRAEINAVNAAVDDLLAAYDAVADLALAEGVHQAVLGNYNAVSATLEAYSKGDFPPEPDVVRTPRGGRAITHRVGLHVDPAASGSQDPTIPVSPRSSAQPAINAWLAAVLPDPAKIGCKVQWTDPATGDVLGEATITQKHLKLQPIDLLYIATLDGAAAMGELDDRLVRYVMLRRRPRGDAKIELLHTVRLPNGFVSFFELAPLVAHLRSLLLRSRPLVPADILAPGGDPAGSASTLDRDRVQTVWDGLKALRDKVEAFAMPASIDTMISNVVKQFERGAQFGLNQVGWGFLYEWRRRTFVGLLKRLSAVVDRWTSRLASFDQGWATYTAQSGAMSDQARLAALAQLDLLVSASALSPRPTRPDDYEQALIGANGRRAAFNKKLNELAGLPAAITKGKLSSLLAKVKAAALQGTSPIAAFDNQPFSLDDIEKSIAAFKANAQERVDALGADIRKRLAAATSKLQIHDSAAGDKDRVSALQQAGKALLGEDVTLLPELKLAAGPAAELANAYTAGSDGALTSYLITKKAVDDPVDDWLHGVARVREKLFAFEQASLLSSAFRGGELSLTPLQLPYAEKQGWLALEFDPNQAIDGDHLLYTAHYPAPCDFTKPIAGILIDEWTEVIPSQDQTAGLAFHFDRPNSEPPQCWPLLMPPAGATAWTWRDAVAAVVETFDLARLRAVEPAQVETKGYAQFLPATSCATMPYSVSIAANFARVNDVAAHWTGRPNG
jgi:hypothetical protein